MKGRRRRPVPRPAPSSVGQAPRVAGHAGRRGADERGQSGGGKHFPIKAFTCSDTGGPRLEPPGPVRVPTGFLPLPLRSPAARSPAFALSNSRSSFRNRIKTPDAKKQSPPFPALLTPRHGNPVATSSRRCQHLGLGESSSSLLHPSSVVARWFVYLLALGLSAHRGSDVCLMNKLIKEPQHIILQLLILVCVCVWSLITW